MSSFALPSRRIAAEHRVGRAGYGRFARRADLVRSRIGAVRRCAGALIAGPVDANRIGVVFVRHALLPSRARWGRYLLGNGLFHAGSIPHARAVLDNPRNAPWVNAVVLQPLSDREKIWVGDRIALAHNPWTSQHPSFDQAVTSTDRLRHSALHILERRSVTCPPIPAHPMGVRDVKSRT